MRKGVQRVRVWVTLARFKVRVGGGGGGRGGIWYWRVSEVLTEGACEVFGDSIFPRTQQKDANYSIEKKTNMLFRHKLN